MGNAEPSQWATVWIETRSGRIEPSDLRLRSAALDEVGALLALRDDISGVQTIDAASSPTHRPQLRVFTTPAAIEAVEAASRSLLAGFDIEADLRNEVADDEEWRDTWKRFYRPLIFGDHQLLLRPSWIERPATAPTHEIVLDPGRAFGTGLHQSTALCLERICDLARTGFSPKRVLDLGCGSGVLGLAAAMLFPMAETILCVDVDPEAVETAKENALINNAQDRVGFRAGPIESLSAEPAFDLAIANIRPVVLIPAATPLHAKVVDGGRAMLSGILEEEAERVLSAFREAGWHLDRDAGGGRRNLETWTGLDFVRTTS